jgi:hypothetical protein
MAISFFFRPASFPRLPLQPGQIVRAARQHWHGQDFWDFVGVQSANGLLDLVVEIAAALRPALPFFGGLDFSLPVVSARDRADDLHARRQALFHERPANPLGVCAMFGRGDDLDVIGHGMSVMQDGVEGKNGVQSRPILTVYRQLAPMCGVTCLE